MAPSRLNRKARKENETIKEWLSIAIKRNIFSFRNASTRNMEYWGGRLSFMVYLQKVEVLFIIYGVTILDEWLSPECKAGKGELWSRYCRILSLERTSVAKWHVIFAHLW